MTTLLLLLFEL